MGLRAAAVSRCPYACSLSALVGRGALEIKMAAMGDSLTDEYSEPYYGTIGNYAQNSVQQLAANHVVDFGPTAAAAGQPGGIGTSPATQAMSTIGLAQAPPAIRSFPADRLVGRWPKIPHRASDTPCCGLELMTSPLSVRALTTASTTGCGINRRSTAT